MQPQASASPPTGQAGEDEPPTPSLLAHTAEVFVDALAGFAGDLSDLVGADEEQFFDLEEEQAAMAGEGEGPQAASSESDWEQEGDGYEDLDFGALLKEPSLREEMRQFVRRRVERLQERRARLLRHALHPTHVLLRDKLTFVAGTFDLLISAYWLGWSPDSFYRLYTAKAAVLFIARWVYYRMKKWHYYLLDLCYYAQLLLLLQVWAYPTSITLTKVCFAFNLGPLLWSIVAFRNSLVFHSLDKVTSHFLHFFPACVSWAARFHPSPALLARLEASPEDRQRWESARLQELSLLPMLPYCLWAVLYYAKIFVISRQRIQQRGYDTLFKYATKSRRSLFGAVVLRFPPSLQPAVYMLLHMLLAQVAMLFNTFWWRSYTACTAFLLGIFVMSAWNGANFYFEIFAHRYVSQVGLGPRAAKPTPSGSQEPSRQQQHPQRQDSGAATVSTASLRHKAE